MCSKSKKCKEDRNSGKADPIESFIPFGRLPMDRGDHFKVVGLKKIWTIQRNIQVGVSPFYLAFARHLIYHLNKYNMNVHMCYTIQYSQYDKQTLIRLILFEVTCSAEASLAILIAGNKLLSS